MKPILFAFPADRAFAAHLATHVDADPARLDLHEFPDGETLVRLDGSCVGRPVIFVCGGREPNVHALPLFFAAATARELGATRVGLVAPYLAYMRQDQRFHAGEAVSAAAYARFLSASFDWLVTVDPHLHRVGTLADIYSISATSVCSAEALAPWIAARVSDAVIVGPDHESEQWTSRLASLLGVPWTVLDKQRRGDREVTIRVPDETVITGRTPVIVDDIASTGRTLARALEALRAAGARPPLCVVIHALFAADAERVVRQAGAACIASTNTLVHETNEIDVAPLVAAAVRKHLAPR
jgi:ribose-phosphate pyrophosphokinase